MTATVVTLTDTVGISDVLTRAVTKTVVTDTVGISDVLTRLGTHSRVRSNTVGISDTISRSVTRTRTFSEAVGITESASGHLVKVRTRTNAVGITNTVPIVPFPRHAYVTDTVGISNTISSSQTRIQYDTWRPVPSPDNVLILACRTPEGEHDSPTGFSHMTLWTFHNDGTNENVVWQLPSVYGWDSYGHPEWNDDGTNVVVWAETSTAYQLVVLDTTGWDRGA